MRSPFAACRPIHSSRIGRQALFMPVEKLRFSVKPDLIDRLFFTESSRAGTGGTRRYRYFPPSRSRGRRWRTPFPTTLPFSVPPGQTPPSRARSAPSSVRRPPVFFCYPCKKPPFPVTVFTVCPEGGLFIRISRLLHGFREEGLGEAAREHGRGGIGGGAVGEQAVNGRAGSAHEGRVRAVFA